MLSMTLCCILARLRAIQYCTVARGRRTGGNWRLRIFDARSLQFLAPTNMCSFGQPRFETVFILVLYGADLVRLDQPTSQVGSLCLHILVLLCSPAACLRSFER